MRPIRKEMKIYLLILALTALGLGFSNDIISNYFKDAYQVTAFQRGLIEFPRELPGVLTVLVIFVLVSFNDIKIAIMAQFLSLAGMFVLGVFTPSFGFMLLFIFINSMGMHLFFPLQDSIGLALIKDGRTGMWMGRFKGLYTGFQMGAAIVVFIGFRFGFFSFETPLKWPFLLAGFFALVVLVLLTTLHKLVHLPGTTHEKNKLILRKEYRYYYVLVVMHGVQKQIMMVYGPWVLIDLLSKKADTIAMLGIFGGAIGMVFIPALGRWMDRFGIKAMLYADALSFIAVYLIYGVLAAGYSQGWLARSGWPVLLAYMILVMDRMSTQMGLVRTVYLKAIAVKASEITPTLSFGLGLDHIVSIICATLGGIVWGAWGPQYIFFLAALFSFVNLYVASKVKLDGGSGR